jgi:hypothetical protein
MTTNNKKFREIKENMINNELQIKTNNLIVKQ